MPVPKTIEGREGPLSFFQEFFPKWVLLSAGISFVIAGLGIGWNLLQAGKAAEGLGMLAVLVGSGIGATAIAFLPDTRSYAPRDAFVWHGMADAEQPAGAQREMIPASVEDLAATPVLAASRSAYSASK